MANRGHPDSVRIRGPPILAPMSRSAAGFTLAEVLVATFLVTVGLLAIMTGFQVAIASVDAGTRESTAVFLAEQRLDELRSTAITSYTALVTGTTTENYGSIAGAQQYRRVTTITNDPASTTNTTLLRVVVSYRPIAVAGGSGGERSIVLATLVARR